MTETQVIGSKSFTAVAINCASKAGEWMKTKLGNFDRLEVKYSSQDLVTEVDKGAERLIRNLIQTHFPSHSFLGEEGVEPGAEASEKAIAEVSDDEYLWIVDPVDGTTNYIHGFPFFCVSIALAHKGEVIVGVIYDPMKDELFVAEKGKGAYVHGKRLTVGEQEQLSSSLVATGFPVDTENVLPLNMKTLNHIAPKVRNIRSSGSAALHMAYVASGRLTGFWEFNLNSWDLAAGALMIKEAGGEVTDFEGNPYHLGLRNVAATNGKIHQSLVSEIQNALK